MKALRVVIEFVRKEYVIGVLLTLLVLAAFVLELNPLQELEHVAYDFMAGFRQKEASGNVAIVAIDDRSMKALGGWPWPRGRMAEMIDLLSKYGAKVIGVDVLYPESEQNPALTEITSLTKSLREKPGNLKNKGVWKVYNSLKKLQKKIDGDARLVASAKSSGRVVFPLRFVPGEPEEVGGGMPRFLKSNSVAIKKPPRSFRRELVKFRNPLSGLKSSDALASEFPSILIEHPFNALASRARALGHVNRQVDGDGVFRRESLLRHYDGRFFPSFSLQLALKYLGRDESHIRDMYDAEGVGGLKVKDRRIPTDLNYAMLVSYVGGPGSFPVYSFSDVLEGKAGASAFKKRLVLIGHASAGSPFRMTPLGVEIPDIEATAHVVENIIKDYYVSRPSWAFGLEVGIILYFGLFVSFVFPRVKARVGALIIALSLIPWFGISAFLFVESGYWLMALSPSVLMVAGYAITVSRRFVSVGKKEDGVSESTESNKMLGLSFQSQGMLDMAFERFLKCPPVDESVKSLLYNLGLDFERKRMPGKALAVYEHILKAGRFKDIKDRIKRLRGADETTVLAPGSSMESTLLIDGSDTNPTLGRYEVLRELGRGAMGIVYLGRDPKIKRDVAIKTLSYGDVEESQIEEVKERFFKEAAAAGKLSHPNIMTIYDAGEDHDMAYMAMELLEGKDLSEHCQEDNLLSEEEVMRIVASVAGALDYADKNGVVHRDIKPSNIMVLYDGTVKVTDFGIAKVIESSKTYTGMILGTPSYMSPEQVAGDELNGASDLFSLGVVFYELLTGEKPFKGDSIATIMYNISKCSYEPVKKVDPDVPDCCAAIIKKLLSKSLKKRYKSGADVARDINACIGEEGGA
jgi:serine/threonine-protein kinase